VADGDVKNKCVAGVLGGHLLSHLLLAFALKFHFLKFRIFISTYCVIGLWILGGVSFVEFRWAIFFRLVRVSVVWGIRGEFSEHFDGSIADTEYRKIGRIDLVGILGLWCCLFGEGNIKIRRDSNLVS